MIRRMWFAVVLLCTLYPVIHGCGETINADNGQIKSPNYPRNYGDSLVCEWTVTVSSSSIQLNFDLVFAIEQANDCQYDSVEVYSVSSRGSRRVGDKHCGAQSPGSLTVSSGAIKIKFTSDSSANDKGFSLSFSAVIDGGWSDWSEYSAIDSCSTTCGTGSHLQTRSRLCNNPAAQGGGEQCVGADSQNQTMSCNLRECPVNGGWTDWSDYVAGRCSVTCGSGTTLETRRRTCTSPAPAYDGGECVGESVGTRQTSCVMNPCPIDGDWNAWSDWVENGDCSVTCGEGLVAEKRTRNCNNPEPMYGGANCTGPSQEGRSTGCSNTACQGLCGADGTKLIYAPDFTKYYECQDDQPILKDCPYGKSWDQPSLTCVKVCPTFTAELKAHPNDCYKFIQCIWGFYIVMSCPSGTAWSTNAQVCIHVTNAVCGSR